MNPSFIASSKNVVETFDDIEDIDESAEKPASPTK